MNISSFRQFIPSIFRRVLYKKPYKLMEKTVKQAIETFPQGSWAIPDGAKTFSRVRIGKTADKNYWHEITTFYGDYNKIIGRYSKGSEIPNTVRKYSHDFQILENGRGANVRHIETYKYMPDKENDICEMWRHVSDEMQMVIDDYDKTKKISWSTYWAKKLQIRKSEYTGRYDEFRYDPRHIKTTITEYPFNLGFEPKSAKKSITVDIDMKNGLPEVTNIASENIGTVPTNDKFLPYRFLEGTLKQESLARYFLKEKGLDNAGIKVLTDADKPHSVAHFSPKKREICFKKVPEYNIPIGTAAHEVEHAYQHKLIGQAGLGRISFEKDCQRLYGELTDSKLIEEAKKYRHACDTYPDTSKFKSAEECPEYMYNYLEVKAREAGINAEKEYMAYRSYWTNRFPMGRKIDF